MKYRVVKKYNDAPEFPIKIEKGETLHLIEESDAKGDWPNWLLCKGNNKEGWVPKQILTVEGNLVVVMEDYIATEHNLEIGDILIANKHLNGWLWGVKESVSNNFAWAPLNCLIEIS